MGADQLPLLRDRRPVRRVRDALVTGVEQREGRIEERLLAADQEPQNWLTHHQNYEAHRFSRLDEIDTETVKGLKVAWTFALGGTEGGGIWPHGGLEGTPIVEDGAMYVTDGWGAVYTFDLTGGSGAPVWSSNKPR